MLNICVIVPGMPANEQEWFLPYLTDYLRALSDVARLHVYALKHPGTDTGYSVHGMPVTAFGARGIRLQRNLMNAVTRDHERVPFTHIHAVWANSAGFFGAMIANRLRIPLVVTMGGEELVSLPSIKYGALLKWRTRPALRYAFHHASAIVAASGITLQKLRYQWKVPESKLRQIWFGVDGNRFKRQQERDDRGFSILTVGGLIPVKRHSLLVDAFALVRQEVARATLTIVGEGPLRRMLEEQARKQNAGDAIRFPGWIHHNEMPEAYANADAVAVSSYSEEIPVTLIEALACGKPVISTNVGVAYDLHETGQYPVFISEPDPASFAAALLDVYGQQQSSSIKPIPEPAREQLMVDFTVNEMMKIFNSISL